MAVRTSQQIRPASQIGCFLSFRLGNRTATSCTNDGTAALDDKNPARFFPGPLSELLGRYLKATRSRVAGFAHRDRPLGDIAGSEIAAHSDPMKTIGRAASAMPSGPRRWCCGFEGPSALEFASVGLSILERVKTVLAGSKFGRFPCAAPLRPPHATLPHRHRPIPSSTARIVVATLCRKS